MLNIIKTMMLNYYERIWSCFFYSSQITKINSKRKKKEENQEESTEESDSEYVGEITELNIQDSSEE